ncbi:MAG: hypothetical protein GY849_14305 [Deltaproteobacteria bacterium]|nr:hypothetical protein [Deltaproteobacteria bacterium]
MKKEQPYRKHVYWLTRDGEVRLREELARDGVRLKSAKGVVCTPLDRINKIASVAPEVWNGTCARQGSWYRNSEKKGLYLIVSSFPLEDYEEHKAATITASDFVLPRQATREEKEALVAAPGFERQLPPEWQRVDDRQKRIYLRWARRLGSDVEDYDFLYLSHTANHANFIQPRFFVREDNGIIPYSIDRSAHLCSCCLELFQVLGGEHKKKLVSPCSGAANFARLRPDRFLLVEGHEK